MTEEKYSIIKVKIIEHTEDNDILNMNDMYLYFVEGE